jgi:hypothetical protein
MTSPPTANNPSDGLCSLEYLIGFELAHDVHGRGSVISINDDNETCEIKFNENFTLELPGPSLISLPPPWRIDTELLIATYLSYCAETAMLASQLADLQLEVTRLQGNVRWLETQRVMHPPDEVAIIAIRDEFRVVH